MITTRPSHHAARYHVAGVTDRGPVGVCPRVTSMSEYFLHYGPRTPESATVYDDLAVFFAEGGWEAYVARVVGPGATRGEATLHDGFGEPTLHVVANQPGPHSGEFALEVVYTGVGVYDVWLRRNGVRVDHWPAMTSAGQFAAAVSGHPHISVSTVGSAGIPTMVTTPLGAGSADLGNVTVAHYRQALDVTGGVARGGCVATPALPAGTVGAQLIAHAQDFQKVAILCGSQDDTPESLAASIAPLIGSPGADHAAVFWPWLSLPGTTRPRYQPPSGYVAAVRARTCTTVGYWRQAAGARSTARTVGALRSPSTPDRNEEISERLICPIVTTRHGVQLHGWWSLSADRANHPHLVVRDTMNNIAVDLAAGYATATNHTWDTLAKLHVHVTATTKSVLGTLASHGAFTPRYYEDGALRDPGYTLKVTAPAEQPQDRNVLEVHVAIRPLRLPNLINIRVFRVDVREPLLQEAT